MGALWGAEVDNGHTNKAGRGEDHLDRGERKLVRQKLEICRNCGQQDPGQENAVQGEGRNLSDHECEDNKGHE